MAFRFRQIFKVAPGVRVNLSKSGFSLSVGTRGLSVNIGKKGVTGNVGAPGTGLSFRKKLADLPQRETSEEREMFRQAEKARKALPMELSEPDRQQSLEELRHELRQSVEDCQNFELSLEEKFRRFEPWGIFVLWTIGLFIILIFPLGPLALVAPVPAWFLAKLTARKIREG